MSTRHPAGSAEIEPTAGPGRLTQRATAGAGWSGAAVVARQVLSLGAVAVLARKLGPGPYGLMGIAGTVAVFVTNFRDLGTASAIIQRPTISRELLSTLFWANVAIGAFFSLLLGAASRPIAAFFHEPELAAILWALALSSAFMSLGVVHNALLNRDMQFKFTALADVTSALGAYAVAITMALSGFGVWSLVVANVATSMILTSLYWVFSGWTPSLTFSGTEIRRVSGFSLNLSGFGVLNYFSRNADNLIIGKYLGATLLGFYQMAYNLMLYPLQNVTSILGQVLLPAFSRIQNDNRRFAEGYIRSCCLTALITFPLIAGMGVVAGPLVRTFLGDKWIPVIPIFQILAPVGMFQSVQSATGHIFIGKGRTDWMLRWGALATSVFVCSFFIGVRHGVVGVAAAYGIAYFLLLYPGHAIPFRLIDLRVSVFARQLWPQVVITAVMVAVCVGWQWMLPAVGIAERLMALVSTIVVGACTYVALMLVWRPPVMSYLDDVLVQSAWGPAHTFLPVLRRFTRR